MNVLKKILSNTKPLDMTTEHVTSQIVLDKQQCVHVARISTICCTTDPQQTRAQWHPDPPHCVILQHFLQVRLDSCCIT